MAYLVGSFKLSKYYCQYKKSHEYKKNAKIYIGKTLWTIYSQPLRIGDFANSNTKVNKNFGKNLYKD